MKKKENLILYMALGGVLLLLFLVNLLFQDHWLDSDMAAEMIFSKMLAEENRFIATPNWYYSSEFRVLYTQLIMVPLFHVFHNWHVIRTITNMVFYLLLFGSYLFMLKPLKVEKKWAWGTGILLLLPFSETLMTHMQVGNTYMSHVILIFLLCGLFLRLSLGDFPKKGRKPITLFFFLAGCLICGLSGVRYLLALLCPLVLASGWQLICGDAFQQFRRQMTWENGKALLKGKQFPYVFYSLVGCFVTLVGYLANSLLIAKNFSFQTYETIHFIPVYRGILWERLQNTIGSFLMLFGYIENKSVLSLRGVVTMIAFVLIGLGIFFCVRTGKLLKKEEQFKENQGFLFRLFLAALALNTFVFVFTDSTIVDRYYITVIIFILPLIAFYFQKETIKFDKIVAALLLCGCLCIATAKVVYSIGTVDKNEEEKAVAFFLQEREYSFGYATYWNANIITELTDGQVEIANILDPISMEPFLWSSPKKYYEQEYMEKAEFLLLSVEEVIEYETELEKKGVEKIYETEEYVVFSLENP